MILSQNQIPHHMCEVRKKRKRIGLQSERKRETMSTVSLNNACNSSVTIAKKDGKKVHRSLGLLRHFKEL
jgi:hypothetical protein